MESAESPVCDFVVTPAGAPASLALHLTGALTRFHAWVSEHVAVGPVEPPFIAVRADTGISFARVLSPRGVGRTGDCSIAGALPCVARSGRTFWLDFALGEAHSHECAETRAVSLASLARHVRVDAFLAIGGERLKLEATAAITAGLPGLVRVSMPVPDLDKATLDTCPLLWVDRVAVAGRPLAGLEETRSVRVTAPGLSAPQTLAITCVSVGVQPCISDTGKLFVPSRGHSPPVVDVFGPDGERLPQLDVACIGAPGAAAAFCNATGSLLLASFEDSASKVVCIDPDTNALRWTVSRGVLRGAYGIAILPGPGVAIASSYHTSELAALSLEDGQLVSKVAGGRVGDIAVDAASGIVYTRGDHTHVHAWMWDAHAKRLVRCDEADIAVELSSSYCPIAVIPASSAGGCAHLVLADEGSSQLHVFEVGAGGSSALVHKHTLEGVAIGGLAADPSGGALAVCDGASQAILVLAWPLEGVV